MKTYGSLVLIIFLSNLYADNTDWLPYVPKNFSISVYADVENARQMAVAEDGTVFVGTRKKGEVWALRDLNRDGLVDTKLLLKSHLNMPSGIAYHKGALYIAEVHQVTRYPNILNAIKGKKTGIVFQMSILGKPEIIYSELPDKKHHGWKFIAFNKDKLFIPVGAPCNICNPDSNQFAHLRKYNITTKKTTIVAKGIRNTVGFDWHPETGKLWFTDNGKDWMGDDIPAEELNRIDKQGEHFGYPFIHAINIKDPEFYKDKPETLTTKPPAFEFQAHVAPLGIHFYTGKQFPKKYFQQLLVAQHGSWNRTKPVGYQVMLVTIEKDKVISSKPFISGFLDKDKVNGRPVAIAELEDGSILISDDFSGKIYRVEYNGD